MIQFRPGRKPPTPEKPRLRMNQFVSTAEVAPSMCDFYSGVASFPMYANDNWGDCGLAGEGHMIGVFTAYGQNNEVTFSDSTILAAYSAVGGFDPNAGPPGNNPTDKGVVLQEALNYWRKVGMGGHKIAAFAEVDITDLNECRLAVAKFGGIYLGINFPKSAMDQFNERKPWDVVAGSPLDGGHCINGVGYVTASGDWYVVTWGRVIKMTAAFFKKYVEEGWVVMTDDFFDQTSGLNPEGVDRNTLGELFSSLTGQSNPFPEPVPQPTPEPVEDADKVLASALHRFLKTKTVPSYLRNAANTWLSK